MQTTQYSSKRKFSVALLSIAALFAGVPSVALAQSALDDVMKNKLIKVAVQTDSAPYGYVGTDLKPIGLDIDLANYIGKKLGVAVELVQVNSASRIPALQTKKADIVIATLGKNAEREKVIDFTAAYAPFYQAVFGMKSMKAQSFADLAGKTVGVTRGAMEDQELVKVAPAGVEIKRFEDFNASTAAFVWRGCVASIPQGQWEASTSLAMNFREQLRHIILPQAVKIAIAPTVGFLVQVIKGTALASVIGFMELTKTGKSIANATFNPFLVFSCVALVYFAICYPVSLYAKSLERKLNAAR